VRPPGPAAWDADGPPASKTHRGACGARGEGQRLAASILHPPVACGCCAICRNAPGGRPLPPPALGCVRTPAAPAALLLHGVVARFAETPPASVRHRRPPVAAPALRPRRRFSCCMRLLRDSSKCPPASARRRRPPVAAP